MKLSNRQPVCIIHCKEEGKKWNILQKRAAASYLFVGE